MRLRILSIRFGLLLVGALCISAVPASAAPAAKPLSQSLTGDARAEYESAKLLFEDGDPAGALTKFKRAYEISKDARLLWNVAVC